MDILPSPIIIITGPTAVGKTAISLDLADHLNAEIISADSRQIYKELTIGTAKPSALELTRVPHHFINELSLTETYSAGQFSQHALLRIEDIYARGKVPLVVGGSTLYLHALQFGIADIPPIDASVRLNLEARLKKEGSSRLFAELRTIDPISASSLDSTKTQRLLRSLEVFHATGRPLSEYHQSKPTVPYTFRTIVLNRDRAFLYQRINMRVDQMLDEGLLDEIRTIRASGIDLTTNALKTIGYREPFAYLAGEISKDEMIDKLKQNSRRYAKRQLTWFRRYPSFKWVDLPSGSSKQLYNFILQ